MKTEGFNVRTFDHIDRVSSELKKLWITNAHLSLGQLLCALGWFERDSDDELLNRLREFYNARRSHRDSR